MVQSFLPSGAPESSGWCERAFPLLVLASIAAACGGPGRPSSAFEEVARAHAAPDLEPEGSWSSAASVFQITRGEAGVYGVEWTLDFAHDPEFVSAERRGGELILDRPVAGTERLFFCRFGTREVLVYEPAAWFSDGEEPIPLGSVFTRVLTQDLDAYLPGPDDENVLLQRGQRHGD